MMQAICQGRLLAKKCRAPSVCKASLGREGSGLLAPECLGVSITSFTLKTFAIKNSECSIFFQFSGLPFLRSSSRVVVSWSNGNSSVALGTALGGTM